MNEVSKLVDEMKDDLEWDFTESDHEDFESMDLEDKFEFLMRKDYLIHKI